MYTVDKYLEHKQAIIDPKGTILRSNKSLQEKYAALEKLDVPFSLKEILNSHPVDWSEEDAHIRRVWLRRMGYMV
jgi:hypothetical protein